MSQEPPEGVSIIRDNHGRTFDRYSIVLTTGGSPGLNDCLGLSLDPGSPQGFSQWGECVDGDHMGRPIAWRDLPEDVRRHAAVRLGENV